MTFNQLQNLLSEAQTSLQRVHDLRPAGSLAEVSLLAGDEMDVVLAELCRAQKRISEAMEPFL